MDKILLEAALDTGFLNTNNMVASFEGHALKHKIRLLRTRTLANLAKIEEQKGKNEALDYKLKAERNASLQKITDETQKKVDEMEEKSMKERQKLLEQLAVKQESSRVASIEYNELYRTMSVPVPKYDKKLVKEYPELEERAEKLKAELRKLKTQIRMNEQRRQDAPKPQKKVFKSSLMDIIG